MFCVGKKKNKKLNMTNTMSDQEEKRHLSSSDSDRSFSSVSESSVDEENQDSYGPGGYCPIQVEQSIGAYQVQKKLGYGQFATVWQTSCEKAIKICRADEQYANMVQKEVNILKEIQKSPTCVQLLDDFVHKSDNGKHKVLVMELYGMDMYRLTQLHRHAEVHIPLEVSKSIIRQVLEALQFLESKNILHTDIKPENILVKQHIKEPLTLNDRQITIALGDFGTAIKTDEKAHVYGTTFEYRSPEQVFEMTRLTHDTDVWSAACVIYELFALEVLFEPKRLCLEFNEERWASDASSMDSEDSRELNTYETDLNQLYLFIEMFGDFPRHVAKKHRRWFTARGKLRGLQESIDTLTLEDRLEDDVLERWGLPVQDIADFLRPMFRFNPNRRDSARKMLAHSFLG